MRTITREEVRSHLFQAHHLVTPADSLPEAAGGMRVSEQSPRYVAVCGV